MGLFLYAICRDNDENILEVGMATGEDEESVIESLIPTMSDKYDEGDFIRLIEISEEFNGEYVLEWVKHAQNARKLDKKSKRQMEGKQMKKLEKPGKLGMKLYVYMAIELETQKYELGVLIAPDEEGAWESLFDFLGEQYDEDDLDVQMYEVTKVGNYKVIIKDGKKNE